MVPPENSMLSNLKEWIGTISCLERFPWDNEWVKQNSEKYTLSHFYKLVGNPAIYRGRKIGKRNQRRIKWGMKNLYDYI